MFRRTHPFVTAIALAVVHLAQTPSAQTPSAQTPARPVSEANARLAAQEQDQGELKLQHGEYFEALKQLTRANQLLGNTCVECLLGMAEAMQGMKAYANVLETTAKAIEAANGAPRHLSRAHQLRADAFQALGEKD